VKPLCGTQPNKQAMKLALPARTFFISFSMDWISLMALTRTNLEFHGAMARCFLLSSSGLHPRLLLVLPANIFLFFDTQERADEMLPGDCTTLITEGQRMSKALGMLFWVDLYFSGYEAYWMDTDDDRLVFYRRYDRVRGSQEPLTCFLLVFFPPVFVLWLSFLYRGFNSSILYSYYLKRPVSFPISACFQLESEDGYTLFNGRGIGSVAVGKLGGGWCLKLYIALVIDRESIIAWNFLHFYSQSHLSSE
jgi:hypothetical protein